MIRHGLILRIIVASALLSCVPAMAQKPVPLPDLNSRRLLNDLHITVATPPNISNNMTIGLMVRYGSAFDPSDPQKGGLANLVSRMFMKATADKSAKGIQDELQYLNATLEVKCDWDGIRFVLNGDSSKYERSLLLLYQVVAEAQFTESDFNEVKSSILKDIQKPPDPRQRIHRQLEKTLFIGTTYGRPIEGDQKSVSAITLGDVRYFYRRFFSPSQSALLIVGGVPVNQVFQRAGRIWGVWVRTDDVPFTFPLPRKPAGREIFLENDNNSPAAQFIFGNLFPRREDPAFTSAILAARIFQERLTKLLPTSLVTVGYEGRRMSGPFYVQGQAAADQAMGELQKIRDAAEEMKTAPVSEEELAAARQSVIDEFISKLGTTAGICEALLDAELYRLGSNYAVLFPDQVRRCDADAIKSAANSWIFPGGEILLVRGPAAVLRPVLQPWGSFKELEP